MTVAARPRQRTGSRSSKGTPRPEHKPLWVALDWVEAHCVIPDGFRKGAPLRLYEYQGRFFRNHYLVKHHAIWDPARPVLGPAFVHRRSGLVGPQKIGKDPTEAAHICLEGDGPALFAGWAGKDDGWACSDHGCGCGFEYAYDPGEPMGMRWPTALIQVTAVSEDATANTYQALRPMIDDGPLHDRIPKTSEEFIRLPGGGRIDVVTASAKSRLGQRVTFASQGEAGLWYRRDGMIGTNGVADTQYRGLAGMGGRAVWHTNAWDPSEESLASTEYDAAAKDVYIQFDRPPSGLSFTNREERWRIYRAVYPADVRRENGGHVDLDSIDAEAVGLIAKGEAAQAARFYGNQFVTGRGKAFDPAAWEALRASPECQHRRVAAGFDGSKTGDHTALIAACLDCGLVWVVGYWDPEQHGGEVPRDEVDAAVADLFATRKVLRLYADPPYWSEELATWQGRHGDKVVIGWPTYRNRPMGYACRSFAQAISDRTLTHDGDERLARAIGNANRKPLVERDDKGAALWTIQKETPDSPRKVDAAVAAVLAWEARTDAIAAGALSAVETAVEFISFSD